MKRSIYLIAAALFFAACDKINPADDGTYTVFAGISATWSDGDAVEAIQNVLVEKFTGPRCNNCPDADVTLEAAHQQMGENLVVISVNHPVGQGVPYPGEPDLRTDDGTSWDKYYGINAIPSAFINRDKSKQYTGAMNTIVADLLTAASQTPTMGIAVSADSTADGTGIDITVELQFMQNITNPMTLTLALIEDSLVYRQANGDVIVDDYAHNHMLRDVLTDVWGAEVDAKGTAGEHRKAVFGTYRVKDPAIRLANCHIVAFVGDKSSHQVYNTACCAID